MPFKLGTKTIQLDTPFTHNDIQYPANWIRLATEEDKSAIGMTWEADAVRYDDRFYWDGNINNPKALEDKLEVDQDGNLNYFTARSFEEKPYVKYRNPSVSRDIIPNEHLINWNLPIVLCEGLFDAIAIKRNAIPLLGKNIEPNLMKQHLIMDVLNCLPYGVLCEETEQCLMNNLNENCNC